MLYFYLSLFFGILAAGVGGELFVRGSVGLARWARISAGIIGATVAAFATSSPELSVAISSSLAGKPEISLGDALGSNVINVALILGITLLLGGLTASRSDIKREFPTALFAPILTALLATDGNLSRLDGLVLLAVFLFWMITVVAEVRRQRNAAANVLGEHQLWPAVLACLGGLLLLIAAGRFIVHGAEGIALHYGMSAFIIGAVVVAVGTSVPELATAIISKMRGHDEVGLGTILGSNIFNGLFIIAVAAIIHPIILPVNMVMLSLLFGLVVVLVTFPTQEGNIPRWRGGLLLGLYLLYVAATLLLNRGGQ